MNQQDEELAVAEQNPPTAEPTNESGTEAEARTVSVEDYDRIVAERDQLLDRVARVQAEFENARKRAEREKAEFRDYATGQVVEKFLPVLDNFELALKSESSAEQLRSGVELIVKQMEEVLRQLNVTPVATIGEPFDPHQHEALGSVERDDLPDHTVAEEIRRGYKLSDRLLRPSPFVAFERHEAGDGLVAALDDDVFAGFDLGDEFRETGFRLADFDGDGHGPRGVPPEKGSRDDFR